jgi:CubicO group peptidase (beta-lactamase class C family)
MNSVRSLVESAITEGVFPGACYAYGSPDRKPVFQAVGRHTYCPDDPAVDLDTVWDLASVSKVVGTTTKAMMMYEAGKLDLDRPVAELIPEFSQNGKEKITPRNLMVHNSGLIAFHPYHRTYKKPADVLQAIFAEELVYETGTKSVYSDLSMIVMQQLLERLSGQPLDVFLHDRVFSPLGMAHTGYRPVVERCAPTEPVEPWRAELRRERGSRLTGFWIQGEVHDPTAAVLGGVAGHAGLFSTIGDLAKFIGLLDRGGIVKKETIEFFTRKESDLSTRALGWDTKSPEGSSAGTHFGPRSFGHTGYTGTCLWFDPDKRMWAILLTNRVHPTAENTKIIQFRPKFHDAVAEQLLA